MGPGRFEDSSAAPINQVARRGRGEYDIDESIDVCQRTPGTVHAAGTAERFLEEKGDESALIHWGRTFNGR